MTGSRRRTLIIVGGLALMGVALLAALPEVIRRVAEDQIPKRTGRAVAIEDVDFNLFRGHLALKSVRLADRDGPEPFVEFERLDVRLSLPALLLWHIRFAEINLARPAIRVVRTGPADFNFSDLVAGAAEPTPEAERSGPSRWAITVDRLIVSEGVVQVDDRVVSPAAEWRVHELGVEGTGDEALLFVTAHQLRLEPLQMWAALFLNDFEMRRLNPYVYIPLGTPYRPTGGVLTLALSAQVDSDQDAVKRAVLAGRVDVAREALVQVGHEDPFLAVARLGVEIKEADALGQSLTVASVAIEGLDLKAAAGRDADHGRPERAGRAVSGVHPGTGPAVRPLQRGQHEPHRAP
jgi:uncharacterized protein involved in outer membrane biogenesis